MLCVFSKRCCCCTQPRSRRLLRIHPSLTVQPFRKTLHLQGSYRKRDGHFFIVHDYVNCSFLPMFDRILQTILTSSFSNCCSIIIAIIHYAKFVSKYFMHTRTHILSFFRWQSTVEDFAVVTSKGEHSTDRRFGRHTGTIFFRLPDRPDGNCT